VVFVQLFVAGRGERRLSPIFSPRSMAFAPFSSYILDRTPLLTELFLFGCFPVFLASAAARVKRSNGLFTVSRNPLFVCVGPTTELVFFSIPSYLDLSDFDRVCQARACGFESLSSHARVFLSEVGGDLQFSTRSLRRCHLTALLFPHRLCFLPAFFSS